MNETTAYKCLHAGFDLMFNSIKLHEEKANIKLAEQLPCDLLLATLEHKKCFFWLLQPMESHERLSRQLI